MYIFHSTAQGDNLFLKPHEFNFVQKTLFRKAQKWKEFFEKLVLALQMMAM